MSTDLDPITINLEGATPIIASDLRWSDRGRFMAVRTDAAVYMGYLEVIIFHASGKVGISLSRNGAKADASLQPNHPLTVTNQREAKP